MRQLIEAPEVAEAPDLTSLSLARPAGTVAELTAVARQSDRQRTSRRWYLTAAPAQLMVGAESSSDWVLDGPGIAPRVCALRWDGRMLIASSSGPGLREEVVVQPGAPCGFGVLELLLMTVTASPPVTTRPAPQIIARPAPQVVARPAPQVVARPAPQASARPSAAPVARPAPPGDLRSSATVVARSRAHLPPAVAAPERGRAASGEMTRVIVAPRVESTRSEATVVVTDPLMAERTTSGRRTPTYVRGARVLFVAALVGWAAHAASSRDLLSRLSSTPASPPASAVAAGSPPAAARPDAASRPGPSLPAAVIAAPAPGAAIVTRPAALVPTAKAAPVASHTVARAAEPVAKAADVAAPVRPATVTAAEPVVALASARPAPPPPVVGEEAAPVAPVARLSTRVYAEPSLLARGECPPTPANELPSPEDHMMLQLAIEAYQSGRRSEAHLLFQTLGCRPEVGAAARFMAHLLAPSTAAMLPRDRALRARRLLDEVQRELAEHPELWAQSESLAGAELVNPKLNPYDFAGQPKCNIFIGEMLYRAGFVPPAQPAPGQRLVAFPSVNQMVARARKLAAGEKWVAAEGEQWFDVVPKDRAQPGDLVLIAAKDRGDHLATEHGHVEIISRVSSQDGAISGLGTIGARSGGVKVSATAGRVFGDVVEGGGYVLSEQAVIVRPRMR